MTTLLTNERLLDIWTNEFRTYLKQPGIERWRDRYIGQVRVVNDTPHDEWMKPDFQTRLWKDNPVANIGPGNSVTVTGALTDLELASWLFEAREAKRDDEASVRGARIDALYTRVLQRVAEKQHATKLSAPTEF